MAPRPSFRRRECLPGSQKTPISDLRVSRASAELLWPTSSHLVSPAALSPSPGGARARGKRGSPAPKPSEALIGKKGKQGPWGHWFEEGAPSLLGWTQSRGFRQQSHFYWSYNPLELLHGLSLFPLDLICS